MNDKNIIDNVTFTLPQGSIITGIKFNITWNTIDKPGIGIGWYWLDDIPQKPIRNKTHWDIVPIPNPLPKVLIQRKRSHSGKWR
jgi:hypothetical protein